MECQPLTTLNMNAEEKQITYPKLLVPNEYLFLAGNASAHIKKGVPFPLAFDARDEFRMKYVDRVLEKSLNAPRATFVFLTVDGLGVKFSDGYPYLLPMSDHMYQMTFAETPDVKKEHAYAFVVGPAMEDMLYTPKPEKYMIIGLAIDPNYDGMHTIIYYEDVNKPDISFVRIKVTF